MIDTTYQDAPRMITSSGVDLWCARKHEISPERVCKPMCVRLRMSCDRAQTFEPDGKQAGHIKTEAPDDHGSDTDNEARQQQQASQTERPYF